MSEPKLISPLLDGFITGAPMSQHHGVCCCPAMKENSDDKYIVKIISVPASQSQLDALLLTGAYKDAAAALEYFKEVSDGIIAEAETLTRLSKLEGFVPYSDWQLVPMEHNDLGYDVYLISPYRMTLDKYMRRNAVTHLNAVNLGLDLCAALTICRNAGFLYADLKPGNIYVSDDKEYRIGDLGFLNLNTLKYTTLPSKYRSVYTAPEAKDDMATPNTTLDVYAVGMILYQVYNNGELPGNGQALEGEFPAPVNADYEIAEIILKACAPNPADRWQDPMEMGQALAAYMQRNVINDVPIAPPLVGVVTEDEPVAEQNEEAPAQTSEELAFMQDMVNDETAPDEADAEEYSDVEMTEEVSSMLAMAEDYIAHETPEGVVIPTPAPVEDPVPVAVAAKADAAPETKAQDNEQFLNQSSLSIEDFDNFDEVFDDDYDDEYDEDDYFEEDDASDAHSGLKIKRGWIVAVILLVVLSLASYAGVFFYHNYYQQSIDDMHISVQQNQLTVSIDTQVDPTLLTVTCVDTYGNSKAAAITNGQAVFTELQPGTMYTIKLSISGFHELTGMTSISARTEEQTEITSFTAVTGTEDGSAVLEFSLTGQETQEWMVAYSTDGEDEKSVSFTGRRVTINDLTVGKTYLFELKPVNPLYLIGQTRLEFTASRIITAEDLSITAFTDGSLTAVWSAPEGETVESWTVRCYSDTGYDETLITADSTAVFSGVPTGAACTVEVTAAGMTQPVRASLTANPINISDFSVDASDPMKLTVTWNYSGNAPEGGWLLTYVIDDSVYETVVQCENNSAVISPRIPGATYSFNVTAAKVSSTIFGGKHTYTAPNADAFNAHESYVNRWTFKLCKTPQKENWTHNNVSANMLTSTFTASEKISFIIKSSGHYYTRCNKTILYVIRDADGNVLPEYTATAPVDWYEMWSHTYPYADLTIPKTPQTPGKYSLYLYFDGAAVVILNFTISE